jgi:hypothetical protein
MEITVPPACSLRQTRTARPHETNLAKLRARKPVGCTKWLKLEPYVLEGRQTNLDQEDLKARDRNIPRDCSGQRLRLSAPKTRRYRLASWLFEGFVITTIKRLRSWHNIPIARIDPSRGEQTAQSGERPVATHLWSPGVYLGLRCHRVLRLRSRRLAAGSRSEIQRWPSRKFQSTGH